jgi:mannose-6-phosphate isomerase-like protein (cupin superfamily)
MVAHMSTTPLSPNPTALGQPRWFSGGLLTIRAAAHQTNGEYTMLEILLPPGGASPLHIHYGEDEGFYVLEGSAKITVADQVVELGPGEHAFGPRDVQHKFEAGPEGCRMIWVLTPGGFEDFVHEASVPAETNTVPPADLGLPADIEDIVRRHNKEIISF